MSDLKPIKFRILDLYMDGSSLWNYEVVSQIQDEYHLKGDYRRDSINFDLIELSSGGLLQVDDIGIDEEGFYKKGFAVYKYSITDFGRQRAAEAHIESK